MMNKKGFTIVELLVVVAIIAVLTTVGMASYSSIIKKARDTKRKADLSQIRKALEMYKADYGYYPTSSCGHDCNGYRYSNGGNDWIPGLAQYMDGRVPVDPKNTGGAPWGETGYLYAYGNVGRFTYPDKYDLTAHLESTTDNDRCAVKCWRYYFNNQNWCTACGGSYHGQIYEDSPDR